MPKFRKKPVVIDAWQFNGQDRMEWPEPMASDERMSAVLHPQKPMLVAIKIYTLEGEMTADIGDWIICGVEGELYPCKPDIFEATYEPAE